MAKELTNFFVNIGKNSIQKSTPWPSNSGVKYTISRLSLGNILSLNSSFSMLM